MARYFTMQQAAREVQTHTMVVYRAIRAGHLHATREPAHDDHGPEVLIHEECLRAWLDDRTCGHSYTGPWPPETP